MSDHIITNQRELIHQFAQDTRPPFKDNLFERNDDDLIQALENVILSCQRDKYFTIRVEKFTVVKDYEEVQKILYDYEQEKINRLISKGKKAPENPYSYINLNDSDIMILIVDYYISVNDGIENPHDTLRVLITLPRLVDKYYYRINGNYCYAMLQVVDGSTYNNTTSRSKYPNIVYKTLFMPTRIYRNIVTETDYNGEDVTGVLYTAKLFSKFNPVMEYIFARFGLRGALQFMGLENVIYVGTKNLEIPDTYVFERFGVFITVPKMIFDNDLTTQTVVFTIYQRIGTIIDKERQPYMACLEIDGRKKRKKEREGDDAWAELEQGLHAPELLIDIESDWYWLESLALRFGSRPTTDKGYSVLDSLESIYDIDSHDTLKLPEEYKKDIYYVLRWLIRQFPELRMKENTDISTKKVRREEYLSASYAKKLSKGIYRASDTQKKITIKDIKRYINIDPNFLLSKISKDQLVGFRNDVNDNDAFIPLKFSVKGVSGLGERKGSSVPDMYKYVHPSHLGRVDVDTSSAGDPGMTGIICPMAEIDNRSFADGDWQEPNNWEEDFQELMSRYSETHRRIELVTFQKQMGVIDEDTANAALDSLEAALTVDKVALSRIKSVDETSELTEADMLEDGTLVVYAN